MLVPGACSSNPQQGSVARGRHVHWAGWLQQCVLSSKLEQAREQWQAEGPTAVEAWAATLRKEYPTVLFRSASACLPAPAESVKGKGKERADDAWGLEAVLALFKQWVNEKKDDKPLTVAVVGVTNVRPLLTESA